MDSRVAEEGRAIRRRRECEVCGQRFQAQLLIHVARLQSVCLVQSPFESLDSCQAKRRSPALQPGLQIKIHHLGFLWRFQRLHDIS